eukprot:CAMPEP_0203841736 /NCGR_PEP_ID=MMETSP0359-20131031/1578_1 /ASSEMBLY_ACC=CAM_ASM_000338 /TAXON_ID=268821 /ORGANISM="Scrippsiella Hangoei, Strain SHTV-5" /LENGTH=43 /DNA_ID= /DNA_START= /DNA_END= /DNA_ORIENTATION=
MIASSRVTSHPMELPRQRHLSAHKGHRQPLARVVLGSQDEAVS